MEKSASPYVSSEKDSDLIKTQKQYLGSSCQQDIPIELCLSARASEPEREPQLSNQQLNTKIQTTLFGAPIEHENIDAEIILSSISRSDEQIDNKPSPAIE